MATPAEIEKALTVLSYAYPNFDLPKETVNVYTRLLADMDFTLLRAATLHCASTHKFFPTVAEIRSAAVDLISMAQELPSGIEAWGEVLRQISAVGSYGTPKFSHPLVDDVVRQMGWMNLCLSENQVADRARFLEAYNYALQSEHRQHQMLLEVNDFVSARALEIKGNIKMLADKLKA